MYSEYHTTDFKINPQVESKDIMTAFGFTKNSLVTNKGSNNTEFIMVQMPHKEKLWQAYLQKDEYDASMNKLVQIFTTNIGYRCLSLDNISSY